jgi:hypothetical protein
MRWRAQAQAWPLRFGTAVLVGDIVVGAQAGAVGEAVAPRPGEARLAQKRPQLGQQAAAGMEPEVGGLGPDEADVAPQRRGASGHQPLQALGVDDQAVERPASCAKSAGSGSIHSTHEPYCRQWVHSWPELALTPMTPRSRRMQAASRSWPVRRSRRHSLQAGPKLPASGPQSNGTWPSRSASRDCS